MSNENRDHVAITTSTGVSWNFIVPSTVTTCSDQANEMTDLCTEMFGVFGNFLTPIGLRYGISIYPNDQEIPYTGDTAEPVAEVVRDITADAGITAEGFIASTEVDSPGVRWIPQVPFGHNRLKVQIDSKDRYIDRSDCVVYVKNKPVNRNPTWDPLEITVRHVPNRNHNEIDSEYIYRICVGLSSDVWIEQTATGETNRTYLSRFLERLARVLPYELLERETHSMADMWFDLGLQQYAESFDPQKIF